MSSESQRPILSNGHAIGNQEMLPMMEKLNNDLKAAAHNSKNSEFHGDGLLAYDEAVKTGVWTDLRRLFTPQNAPTLATAIWRMLRARGPDAVALSEIMGLLPTNSAVRAFFVEFGVKEKYGKMLHPPLTYLGDAFQYRTADGKFNNVLSPHLGQAGTPYARTVPSKTHTLGALPDPSDIFDRLMARQETTRNSESGLSSMLLYHATIIIHDIFRTNDKDKNISDSSSYLDLSPLYGYTEEMQRQVRDDKFKLGLLKPDTFAEDRLLRQPPGVCIMLVMYNRYHNYAATKLRKINENGRFSIPKEFAETQLVAIAERFIVRGNEQHPLYTYLQKYKKIWNECKRNGDVVPNAYSEAELQKKIDAENIKGVEYEKFKAAHDAAWKKLDDDLFNTARLITCGLYINISIHDYLRALMGFHQYDSTFTLDPRIGINKDGQRDAVSRGVGNQVTTEFNLLYRFHCAISDRDEDYTRKYIMETIGSQMPSGWEPEDLNLQTYMGITRMTPRKTAPETKEFGLNTEGKLKFSRNAHSGLFNDQKMIDELLEAMDAPVGNFGALNVPKCMKTIEIMGIIQARKWGVGTLNDFRDFFGLPRHKDFASITQNQKVQSALRDLYDHPDQVELYPGIFCEGRGEDGLNLDPGPCEKTFALWAAIFSDAITLVRSDRFYTVDWNTNSLTSWGMKEVTPNNDVYKSSVFHRLIQRAFPGWFPHNSLRFFHPFYTNDTNKSYATAQGYMDSLADVPPTKPKKPLHLKTYSKIMTLISDQSNLTCSSSSYHSKWMPKDLAEIMTPGAERPKSVPGDILEADKSMVLKYFTALTRDIIKREVYVVDDHTYQIDVVRDVAVPVITRYVADFLGFNHRIKSNTNPKGEFSENEIFQHISNWHLYSTYIADETKIYERRMAAKKSMEFLLDLTKSGNIKSASRWSFWRLFWNDPAPTNIAELGVAIARQTLRQEKSDHNKAAAVLLATALDGAYDSVLAFSSVLNSYMKGLYTNTQSCDWIKVQKLAMDDTLDSDDKIQKMVFDAKQLAVKVPLVRRVVKNGTVIDDDGKQQLVEEGDTIICDLYRAYADALKPGAKCSARTTEEEKAYNFHSHRSDGIVNFNSHTVAHLGITAMIKVLAQTRNLRRGHDTQGKPKMIRLDATQEGYDNYMAARRMCEIRKNVEISIREPVSEKNTLKMKEDAFALKNILDSRILRPETEIYLTPEWDEMIPFPTTWKVRFEQYGQSDYSKIKLVKDDMPDNIPPFYQPQGASHFGGSFGNAAEEQATPSSQNPEVAPHSGCGALGTSFN